MKIGALVVAVTIVMATSTSNSPAKSEVEALRETLFTQETNGLLLRNAKELKPIKRLTEIGSPEAVKVLEEYLTSPKSSHSLRPAALVALGKIGTREAVDAIRRHESWAEKRRIDPPPFSFGMHDTPIQHMNLQDVQPRAMCKDKSGATWAVFTRWHYGIRGTWLTKSMDGKNWSDPILLDLPPFEKYPPEGEWALRYEEGEFVLTMGDGKASLRLADQIRDSDKDGFADVVERALQTDANARDSDGDGIPDGEDSNPLTMKQKEPGEEQEMRQAVFMVLFGMSNTRDALVVRDIGEDFARQEYYGFGGPVLRSVTLRQGFVHLTGITVKPDSPTTATFTAKEWTGNMAASWYEGKLAKVHGKWIVTDFMMTMIS